MNYKRIPKVQYYTTYN